MALITCEHCGRVMREDELEAHEHSHHPRWTVTLVERLMDTNRMLDRIASALEGMERR